ncbi:hypothetical protein GCM10009779_14440 [Polymorphospora rubra]|uniref:Uncharacterized protein n=1 Tax=Polymorphospora rubra TaxID=338584 RepID=A0A810MYD7_9ACTN|nr:hypothetical protein Prubr_14160 [Polymorphospora rubra]
MVRPAPIAAAQPTRRAIRHEADPRSTVSTRAIRVPPDRRLRAGALHGKTDRREQSGRSCRGRRTVFEVISRVRHPAAAVA